MAKKTKIITPHEGFQDKFVRTNVDVCFAGGVLNCGKAQPLDSKVLTPNGWVRMGDLKIGDVVCTPFGNPAQISGIFDHKDKDIYRLTTSDGKTTCCCSEHLWAIRTETQIYSYRKNRDKARNLTITDTLDVVAKLGKSQPIYIPNIQAVEFSEKSFVIPPYVLGVILGDGCITESSPLRCGRLMIANTEEDVIARTAEKANATKVTFSTHNNNYISVPNGKDYYEYLHNRGLTVKSYDKFIPDEYLFGSIEQRRELLAGLFDTDGTVGINNTFVYSTTSYRLRDDIISLCRSLGYKATYTDKSHEKFTSGHEYLITVQTNDFICKSKKHKSRYEQFASTQYKTDKFRRLNDHSRIKSIDFVGVGDVRCIMIDDPMHLYITDDYIVTHNTTGAVLMCAQPSLDPNFRGVFLRNNLGDIRSGGGILDEFKSMYRGGVNVVESGEPRVEFPSGARIDVTHIADQSREKVRQRFKGRQYDLIYFDEMTGFSFECFCEVCTRNRGTGKWTGKIRGTTNPERNHWLREFLDWYIGIDGFIREDRNGVVRYFYMSGETVRDVVWGDSKEEVYQKCKIQIDRQLARINGKTGNATYKDLIRSFTFYLGKMTENVSSIGNNSGYVGAVAMSGGRNAEQLLEGNWNVSPNEALDAPIPQDMANQVFMNDDKRNGDRWVTCDLADTGTDNFLAIAWDGFHIIDMLILGRTTPRQNAERLQIFAAEHDVADNHIIYDAIRGTYINDYIPDAVPYVSYRAPMGMYGRLAQKLKDECYLRLVETIKRGDLSIEESVALRTYEHQNLKERITIQNEFMEECAVVRFKDVASGKKALLTKKEMNQKLGKGRSMDLLDPIAMRMYPVLEFAYGEELEKTTNLNDTHDDDYDDWGRRRGGSIYDDSFWC